jgi:hypothetical protein
VADAVRAVERAQANDLFEVAQFAFGATDLEIVLFVDDRDTGLSRSRDIRAYAAHR